MAIAVQHKNVFTMSTDGTTGYAGAMLLALHTVLSAHPDKYTILETSGGADGHGDWFVFKQVGGTWEMWLGACNNSTTLWSSGNRGGAAITAYTLCAALSPAGGWDVGVDEPAAGTMFSNAPLGGTYWTKIQSAASYTGGGENGAPNTNWLTVISDPAVGYFYALFDYTQNNSWNQGIAILPYTSTNPADEAVYPPFLWIGGCTDSSSNGWLRDGSVSTNGSMLLPGNATACNVVSRFMTLDATNQPNPRSGKYDTYRLPIKSTVASVIHQAGFISAAAMRQIDSTRAQRSLFNEGSWLVPGVTSGMVIPWDGSAL
jgi:hypothetical protein